MFLFGDRVGGLWLYGRVADVQVPGAAGVSDRDDARSVGLSRGYGNVCHGV